MRCLRSTSITGMLRMVIVIGWSCLVLPSAAAQTAETASALATDSPSTDSPSSDSPSSDSPSSGALSDSIWFDAEQNHLLPIDVDPQQDDSVNRDSRWLPGAKRVAVPDAAGSGTAGGGATGGGLFGTGLTIGNLFGWVLLMVVVGTAVFAVSYLLSKSELDFHSASPKRTTRLSDSPDQQTLERMKHLPAELRRSGVNFRSEAERLMGEGSFDQAIILLFAHQLLLLDRAGLLRLNRGKTNRRYVRETQSVDRESARLLKATVDAFERSYFGRHSINLSEFASLWSDNERLEESVRRRQEAAA